MVWEMTALGCMPCMQLTMVGCCRVLTGPPKLWQQLANDRCCCRPGRGHTAASAKQLALQLMLPAHASALTLATSWALSLGA